ncbi:heme-binding domain-containing protein [Granulicella arctica]|uniref:heme-binding domain-containing protein n=1 Tax=Granulicella arctica TaxID=940613 RepID=UPI0021E0D83E|nr:heme-binding domain-containing protein [Granulicella arctica]
MKWVLKLAALAFVVFVVLQFVRPTLKNPPVTAEIQAPVAVKAILRKDCYSCHSNETKLPWFDQVVPAYWLVAHDVKTARMHLNFSEIGKLPPEAQRAMLFEAVNQVQLGAMPLPSYRHVHPESTVTPEELVVLRTYLDPFGAAPKQDAALTAASDAQFHAWTSASTPTMGVHPALNGLAFFPDYKNWKEISTTDRGDNHTMRVITGNDIAIKAIEEKKVQPWPDGAAFAKIAWDKVADENGVVHAGSFKQVEFMVKDKAKYASTAGWGWGRWKGMDLKPYGKDEKFAGECVSCHKPVADNDYVYTKPVARDGQVSR